MFLAILDAHYNDYDALKEDDENDKLGFFAFVIMIIKEEVEKRYKDLKKVNVWKNLINKFCF